MTASEYCPVTPEIIEDLKRICGDAFVHYDGEKMLEKYSRDKVPGQSGHLPEVVVMPKTAREVAEVVKLDMVVADGKVTAYRARINLSFKLHESA